MMAMVGWDGGCFRPGTFSSQNLNSLHAELFIFLLFADDPCQKCNRILIISSFSVQNWSAGLSGHITVDLKEVRPSSFFVLEMTILPKLS
jgi:hypothetical protein